MDLSKGLLGPETSALLGGLIVSQLWQAILGRAAIPLERRHPVFVYVDEFQDYLHLPLDFADALAQARVLGARLRCWPISTCTSLGPPMRSAVLGERAVAGGLRLPSEDARVVAADSALAPDDFQVLELSSATCSL